MANNGSNNDIALLNIGMSANLCSLSRSAFYKFVKAGRAPKPVKIGRSTRWRRQELLEWIANGCPDFRLADRDGPQE